MKRNFGIAVVGLVMVIAFPSCEKDFEEEELNLSNSVPAYVEFANASGSVEQGNDLLIPVQIPTTQTKASTVSYEIDGGFTGSGTVELEAESYRTNIVVSVPDFGLDTNEVVLDAAMITLTGITSGYQLGRTEGEKITFSIDVEGPKKQQ